MRWSQMLMVGAVALTAISGRAKADVITFDEVPSSGNPILTSLITGDFTFTSGHFHTLDDPGSIAFGGGVSNGTTYIAEEAGAFGLPITMAPTGGGTFSLNGLDAARLFLDESAAAVGGYPNADFLEVLGNLSGGGTVSASFALGSPPAFATFALPTGFVGLTSVTFSGSLIQGGAGGISLDNIRVNEVSAVPEPSTLLIGACSALLYWGLVSPGRRRKRLQVKAA